MQLLSTIKPKLKRDCCWSYIALFISALGPRWNETFTFTIHVPELALVRFVVEDQISLTSNDFLGQYSLPLLSMNKGIRFFMHNKSLPNPYQCIIVF